MVLGDSPVTLVDGAETAPPAEDVFLGGGVDATEHPADDPPIHSDGAQAAPPAECVSLGGGVDTSEPLADDPPIHSTWSDDRTGSVEPMTHGGVTASLETSMKRRSTRDLEGAAADKKARVEAERLEHDAAMCAPFPDSSWRQPWGKS